MLKPHLSLGPQAIICHIPEILDVCYVAEIFLERVSQAKVRALEMAGSPFLDTEL